MRAWPVISFLLLASPAAAQMQCDQRCMAAAHQALQEQVNELLAQKLSLRTQVIELQQQVAAQAQQTAAAAPPALTWNGDGRVTGVEMPPAPSMPAR